MRIELTSGGGGGWGDPLARSADLVKQDVKDGIVSIEAAKLTYGVILDESNNNVDEKRSMVQRQYLRGEAGKPPIN